MRALVLSDNTANEPLTGEWGLSVYITYADKKILLDAGASPLFINNAEKLGVDLTQIDFAVLSHAHFDHADGLPAFFQINPMAKCFLQKSCGADCYKIEEEAYNYIGITESVFTDYADRLEKVEGLTELCKGVYLLSHDTLGFETIGIREQMFVKTESGYQPDVFAHEQSLIFKTENGLVIFNSCTHVGVVNTIWEVQKAFPGMPIVGFIGGFHLFNKTDEEVYAVANAIKETGVGYICTGHCTGDHAYDILEEILGNVMHKLSVGFEMRF